MSCLYKLNNKICPKNFQFSSVGFELRSLGWVLPHRGGSRGRTGRTGGSHGRVARARGCVARLYLGLVVGVVESRGLVQILDSYAWMHRSPWHILIDSM